MAATQEGKQKHLLHGAFGLYLLCVHVAYALLLNFRFDWLIDPQLSSKWFSFPEMCTLTDLVIVPALLYAFLARKQPKQALIGAFAMCTLGLLAIRLWFPKDQLGAVATQLLAIRQWLSPLLTGIVLIAEIGLILLLLRALKKPMKEPAIELMLAPMATVLGSDSKIMRILYAEQRIWIYALSRALPAQTDFAGDLHFGYAKQNGNASTMIGMCIANLAPTPILHVVIAQFSPTFAWITTALVLLTSFFMWAEYRATLARPLSLSGDTLFLRYGTLTDRKIALSQIRSARQLSWRDEAIKAKRYQGFGAVNVEIMLDGEVIHIGLNEPGRFVAALALNQVR